MKKLNTETFILRSKEKHHNKYDYSKVVYKNSTTKVCIICPEHGEFWQTPTAHLQGQGCPKCTKTSKLTTEKFIEKAKTKHNNKYDYSKVVYGKNNREKVCIICPEHGEFWQQPSSHLKGQGCPICANQYSPTTEEWVERAKAVHGNKYNYSKSKYINSITKICVICPEHGEFYVFPNNHLNGNGCPKCKGSNLEQKISNLLIKNNIKFEFRKHFSWLKNKKPLEVDFYLPDYNVAIECQGEQHLKQRTQFSDEKRYEKQFETDLIKNKLCKENKIKLLYFGGIALDKIEINDGIYDKNTYFTKNKLLIEAIKEKS